MGYIPQVRFVGPWRDGGLPADVVTWWNTEIRECERTDGLGRSVQNLPECLIFGKESSVVGVVSSQELGRFQPTRDAEELDAVPIRDDEVVDICPLKAASNIFLADELTKYLRTRAGVYDQCVHGCEKCAQSSVLDLELEINILD